MLLSISPNFQSRVINSLKWLTFSLSPIRVDWLAEIFTLRPECTLLSDETEKPFFSGKDILKYFSSLIVIADHEVRLAHFSIKEYLASTQIANGPALAFGFTEVDAHLHIAHSCLAYHLQHADNMQHSNYQQLGYYAGRQWARHLEMIPSTLWPSDIIQKAMFALDTRSKSLAKMISLMRAKVHHQNLFLLRPLCYTSWQGLLGLTMMLLSREPETNIYFTQEDLDVALQYAAYGGSMEMVRWLLDKGAEINVKDDTSEIALQAAANRNPMAAYLNGSQHDPNTNTQYNLAGLSEYGSALQAAASGGHLDVVKFLLDNGADIDAQYGKHGSALHAAAAKDHIDIVKLLVSRGADIHARSSEAGSVLASAIGHYYDKKCLDFLLDKGALKKDDGETALSKAAAERCWVACHLLLSKGANVNAKGGRFGPPLQAACARSLSWDPDRPTVIERLLDLGADVNAQGGVYGNALQAACVKGKIDLVRLLLDKGADVNAQGGLYGNALQASFFLKRKASLSPDGQEVIKLLLSRGANINARGGKYGNALQAACAFSIFHDSIATAPLLFAHGVDIHAKGGVYGTALQAASAAGLVMTANQLLEQGADVNEQGGRYGTALQAAYTHKSHQVVGDMVKLLLSHSADVHLKGGEFGSALNAAAANINLPNSAIQQLLDRGVDINDSDHGRHGTALQAALEGIRLSTDMIERAKRLERLEFLLKCGADVNVEAGHYGFALQSACTTESGYFPLEVIDTPMWENIGAILLLDNCPNININAKGGNFGSALQAAAHSGQTESVRLLIQKGADVNAQGGKYRNALNAAIIRGFWDIVRVLLENGAEPDCYRSENPDLEWLKTIEKEYGRGAKERYEKIWEIRNPNPNKKKKII
jgi:ankyrin repeat protein